APLLLSSRKTTLGQTRLAIGDDASIAIEQFVRDDRGIATKGRLEHLHVGQLLQYLKPDLPISTDLALGGNWDIKLTNRLEGSFSQQRESSDIAMLSNAPVKHGLTTLNASGTASNGRLALKFLVEGQQTGRIDINVNTTIGSRGANGLLAI